MSIQALNQGLCAEYNGAVAAGSVAADSSIAIIAAQLSQSAPDAPSPLPLPLPPGTTNHFTDIDAVSPATAPSPPTSANFTVRRSLSAPASRNVTFNLYSKLGHSDAWTDTLSPFINEIPTALWMLGDVLFQASNRSNKSAGQFRACRRALTFFAISTFTVRLLMTAHATIRAREKCAREAFDFVRDSVIAQVK